MRSSLNWAQPCPHKLEEGSCDGAYAGRPSHSSGRSEKFRPSLKPGWLRNYSAEHF
jgi:hypothetical protein